MGVNTPTEAVIIAGLSHPGNEDYSVAEYKNIAGRAGRLGYATRGTSLTVALTPNEEHSMWNQYIVAEPEDLPSKFFGENTDPRTLVMLVLAAVRAKRGLTSQEIVGFLEESFGAFQEKIKNPSWKWDERSLLGAIEELRAHQLIEQDGDGFYHPTPLGRLAGESGLEVESVLRVVAALNGLSQSDITDPSLVALSQLTAELDDVFFPMNKRSTQKEPRMWMSEVRNQGIAGNIVSAFHHSIKEQAEATRRAKKTVACLLWITDRQLSDIEGVLMQFDRGDTAAGAIRSVGARVCDVLPTVAKIAELLNPGLDLGGRVERLLVRLELGIPVGVFELGNIMGRILNRGDYLFLLKKGIGTKETFETAKESELLECLDGDADKLTAAKIRLQEYEREEKLARGSPILPAYEG